MCGTCVDEVRGWKDLMCRFGGLETICMSQTNYSLDQNHEETSSGYAFSVAILLSNYMNGFISMYREDV